MGVGGSTASAASEEKIAVQNIGHFDHRYDAVLVASSEDMVAAEALGGSGRSYPADVVAKLGEGRIVVMMMRFDKVELVEGEASLCVIAYSNLKTLEWDHAMSGVKLVVSGTKDRPRESYVVLRVANSLELESEAKLRLRGLAQAGGAQRGGGPAINLQFNYVGVFAGPTKPKPFQRKRANLSQHEQGKLPQLATMRDLALARHTGSGAPTRSNDSRRQRLALHEIHKGVTSLTVVSTQERGKPAASAMLAVESRLELCRGYADVPGVRYVEGHRVVLEASWDEVVGYEVLDRAHQGEHANGVELHLADGRSIFFVVLDVLHAGHAVEHFWNRHALAKNREPMPKSTHGRVVVKVTTLEGEVAAPPRPRGDLDVVDESGVLVRAGADGDRPLSTRSLASSASSAKRKSTLVGSYVKGKKPSDWRLNPRVDKFWDHVVKHQGWLLKKGGVAKTWIKRYAVLYSTAMGHFLCYYADFAKSPLFHAEERERRVIDLSKTTFVRPRSNNKEAPANSFDICTIEREWTLSAESKASMQQWLRVITRAIDEDVAVVPDDELVFLVKPRVDPSMQLVKNEYSTALKVSASGVAVCHVSASDEYQERFFWCYTDFFKWSILHHQGKTGLQVSVFTSADFDVKDRHEFLFRTRDAVKLATAIEFYIEKFMAAMHLYLEGTTAALANDAAPRAARDPADSGLNMATHEMGQDAIVTDDLLGTDPGDALDDDDDDNSAKPAPPAPAAAEKNGHNNIGSILDLFTVEETAQPATAPDDPFANSLHATDDPFAPQPLDPVFVKDPVPPPLDEPPPPPPPPPQELLAAAAAPPPPPELAPAAEVVDVDATKAMLAESPLYDALARLNERSGTLYENEAISVSVEQEYRGSQGRLLVTVHNEYETPTAVVDLSLDLDVGGSGLRYHVGPLSSTTLPAPGDSAAAQVMLECMQPFDEAPAAVLAFAIAGQRYQLKIALPSLFTKFLEPVDLAPQVFVQRWATLGAPGLECMQTFAANAGPANAAFARPRLETLVNLAFVAGVDDNQGTILSAAAALRTGTENAGGDKISVGCLLRLEMNEAYRAYRLTVRTAVPRVSASLAAAIQKVL